MGTAAPKEPQSISSGPDRSTERIALIALSRHRDFPSVALPGPASACFATAGLEGLLRLLSQTGLAQDTEALLQRAQRETAGGLLIRSLCSSLIGLTTPFP